MWLNVSLNKKLMKTEDFLNESAKIDEDAVNVGELKSLDASRKLQVRVVLADFVPSSS